MSTSTTRIELKALRNAKKAVGDQNGTTDDGRELRCAGRPTLLMADPAAIVTQAALSSGAGIAIAVDGPNVLS